MQFSYMTVGEDYSQYGVDSRSNIDELRHSATKEMAEYLNDLGKSLDASRSISESMVRAYHVLDRRYFAIEQQVSICFQQHDKGWTGMFCHFW